MGNDVGDQGGMRGLVYYLDSTFSIMVPPVQIGDKISAVADRVQPPPRVSSGFVSGVTCLVTTL